MTTWTPLPLDRVEVDREGRDQGLAFAGLHLGDLALVEDDAALDLHVEVPLAERALRRLAHRGEGIGQDVVQGLAVGEALAQPAGPGLQGLVVQFLDFRLQRVDRRDRGIERLDETVVGGPEDPLGKSPRTC